MTVKQWLMRARNIESRIASLVMARQRAYDRAVSIVARPREVCVIGGGVSSPDDKNASYVIVGEAIKEQEDKLNAIRAEIIEAIGVVEDNTLAALLTEYYVNGRTWEDVAFALDYSYSQVVKYLHPKALKAINDAIECHNIF